MLLNLFDQYTNLCYNITKMFFLYIILSVCLYLYIYWLIDYFGHALLLLLSLKLYLDIFCNSSIQIYNIYIDDEIDDDDYDVVIRTL